MSQPIRSDLEKMWSDPQFIRLSPLKQILYSRDLRTLLPWLGLSAFFSNLLALAMPLTMLQIFNRVLPNQAYETLALLVMGVVAALLLEKFLRTLNDQITSWLGARYEHGASLAALGQLLRVSLGRYQTEEPSAYAQKLISASRVANFYSGRALLVLFDLPFVVLFLGVVFLLGGQLVLVPIGLLLLFTIIFLLFVRWIRDKVQFRQLLDDRRFSFLYEVITGIHTVKAQALETAMARRYERLQQSIAGVDDIMARGNALANSLGVIFSQIMMASVIFTGAWLVITGNMTPGSLAACMMLSVRSMQPLRRGLDVWLRYQSFIEANKRLNEILSLPPQPDGAEMDMPPVTRQIRLENITVRAESGKPLFEDLSLDIPAGGVIAIQGESGSGKSMLLDVMTGLVQPEKGTVWFDDRPLTEFASAAIHRQVARLPQNSTILTGTILENMTLFRPELESEALLLAGKLGLDEVVAGMPNGYTTLLGEGLAEVLPAGVRQMISLVRALVHPVSVVLFDEANLSLDFEGDRCLREYLASLKGQVTLVLISHRPSWVTLADDHVYVIQDGRLIPKAMAAPPHQTAAAAESCSLRPEGLHALPDLVRNQFVQETDFVGLLLPLLEALNWRGQPRKLLECLPHFTERLDLSDFCSVMSRLCFQPRHFHGNLTRLDRRLMPLLFVPENDPAVVILDKSADNRLLLQFSSETPPEWYSPVRLSGEVFVFAANEAAAATAGDESRRNFIRHLVWQFRKHIALMIGLSVLITCLGLAAPMYIRIVYDRVLPTGDIAMGAALLLGVLLAVLLELTLMVLRGRVLAHISGRSGYILGNGIFSRVLNMPAKALENASAYRQVGRIRFLEGIRDQFTGPLAAMLNAVPAALILTLVLGLINPAALGIVGFAILLFVGLFFFVRLFLSKMSGDASRYSALRWELLNETLSNMRTLRILGAGLRWLERYRKASGKAVMANYRDTRLNTLIRALTGIIAGLTGISGLVVTALLVMQGHLSGGLLMMTMLVLWRLISPLQTIFTGALAWMRTRSGVSQINQLMARRGEQEMGQLQTLRPHIQGILNFRRVSFRYANDKDPVLLGLNFKVPAQRFLVITGVNGAGKSSLLKLILQLYIPQAGAIRLDDIDIRQIPPADLRNRISYMPQQCQIFYGTIEQNLRLVHASATAAELDWAVAISGLREDLSELPEGIGTRINNARADQLPNGFRQRLSLARTMLRPATLILMDEPGNGMDDAGEIALQRCLQYLRGRATIIMVSHRPAHMRQADSVMLLQAGAIVLMGTFETHREQILAGLG